LNVYGKSHVDEMFWFQSVYKLTMNISLCNFNNNRGETNWAIVWWKVCYFLKSRESLVEHKFQNGCSPICKKMKLQEYTNDTCLWTKLGSRNPFVFAIGCSVNIQSYFFIWLINSVFNLQFTKIKQRVPVS